ncbi:hypothetical protein SAMN02745216_01767 [Desulfatibacillum alkenivorans DSM 16219]|jgi:ribosomal protein L32|uniref:Uncharacterized protein n=1 Tax=Desulfatibacillum alkenivorans DSM 16219 TaxID=1121393 RepID=A0A1M6JTI9_9BACT|nr:hypothetical protein [Desulfatibacillum alkenivorans]SHJ49991.1 hypothetical protein SAMN02745216_01767 [Desulfatibacillum alkenivorans DSM 16219]
MEPQYNIIFRDEILSGKDPENARKVLTAVFKQQAPKVLTSMNGGAPYIRKNLTLDQARKFKAVFDKAGAQIQVVKTFKCPDCGHIQKTNSQCEKCMNLKMEFESGPNQPDEPPAKAAANPKPPKEEGPAPTFSTKKLNQFSTYKLVFKGEIQPGFDQDAVKKNLAIEFKAEVFQVNAPFAGGDDYHQGQLNGIKAEELRERFERAGALVEVIETVKCPMCGKVLEAGENCPDCFEEHEGPVVQDAGYVSGVPESSKIEKSTFGEEVGENEEFRREAAKRFTRGAIILSVLFAWNYYAGKGVAFDFDLTYLLSAPYFCRGCFFMAKAKGYSKWFWLLGPPLLIGVGVMYLMPDKSSGKEKTPDAGGAPFYKRDYVWGAVCLTVMAILPLEDVVTHFRYNAALKKTNLIMQNASDMSYTTPPTEQANALIAHLDELFSIQSYYRVNSRQAILIREGYTSIMECFFIGLQGKHLRQSMSAEGVLDGYSVEEIFHLKKKVIEAFEDMVLEEPTPITEQTYIVWYMVTHKNDIPESFPKQFMQELNSNIDAIMDILKIYMEENYLAPPIHEDQIFNPQNYASDPNEYNPRSRKVLEKAATISIDKFSGIHLVLKETSFTPKEYVGSRLVFVPKVHKEFKNSRETHIYRYYRVGGDLPDYLLGKRDVLARASYKMVERHRVYQKHHPLLTR